MSRSAAPPHAIVGRAPEGDAWLIALVAAGDTDTAATAEPVRVADADLIEHVRAVEGAHTPRWTVRTLRTFSPPLLAAGIRLRRAHDLVLCHAILRDSAALVPPLPASERWTRADPLEGSAEPGLFDMGNTAAHGDDFDDVLGQWREQLAALERAPDGRLALLCAAESTGALIAEEMTAAGLPWSTAAHQAILVEQLGPRPLRGGRPARMAQLAVRIGDALEDDTVSPDSPPRLLRALHRAGVFVESTSKWELSEIDHPVVEPLLEYKRLARLFTANGWTWLDDWVRDDRFRPIYLTGGVVTGRWASSGGGALQIPRQLRRAVRADPGWTLVDADVAQLEPRVLAAMSHDSAMADAARGRDLYEGVVRSGAVGSREEAKYAVLGAMYGATTGESGRLVPRLRTVFPKAMNLVDAAARTGEQGGVVSTLLGRSSPRPDDAWTQTQSRASGPDAGGADESRARSRARDRGRFTRNFVVQGTAAEWALLWLAEIRHRLMALPPASEPATASGPVFADQAHLALFLHDEVIVHCPADQAEAVADAVRAAAAAATARLFPGFPIDVPLVVNVSQDAGKHA
ncbi:bifunctional 3'-5' exonuclease/DNA polymerase [Microbacterium sp. H1-D42]|uniref:bifunctional 3'-5' exonuclease/DNA polymerase n=1 Tax=Microbacterium sp. H1-D42 TaxID=2925844 RepID=UPI001F533AFB|nr:bifunctional 3'-5' exonuclease/DNA polymerase [Microbacterium sp. H1-D42]UNK72374.1 bifunctional 3'-5' exonuclease/DNA polymerase [Microbacterium sp. H1-D42]